MSDSINCGAVLGIDQNMKAFDIHVNAFDEHIHDMKCLEILDKKGIENEVFSF